MKEKLIENFSVEGLALIFRPVGLPLVFKGGAEPTTSVLIQGAAGTGKTTLAVSIAKGIVNEIGGMVYYLTTEVAPTEILFKARTLGFPETEVRGWDQRSESSDGFLLVEHLRLHEAGRDVVDEEDRKRAAIDVVWEALETAESEKVHIRVVVIDALTVPGSKPPELLRRSDMLEFVQAVESRGVTLIIIEEEGATASPWLSFVVDVVFRIAYYMERVGKGPEALLRKLSCTKSRYSRSNPGPHRYGLSKKGKISLQVTYDPSVDGQPISL